MKKTLIFFAIVVSFSLLGGSLALAKYPDKPVTYIISFNPGGESDITARLQEKPLEKELGRAGEHHP